MLFDGKMLSHKKEGKHSPRPIKTVTPEPGRLGERPHRSAGGGGCDLGLRIWFDEGSESGYGSVFGFREGSGSKVGYG